MNPGRSDGTSSLVLFHQRRPSLITREVGSCINRFEACSTFTHVTACMLAESPMRPSAPEAPTASFPSPPLRLLPGGANQFPGGTFTRSEPAPFTAHAQLGCYDNGRVASLRALLTAGSPSLTGISKPLRGHSMGRRVPPSTTASGSTLSLGRLEARSNESSRIVL
jgi:hypothetical protein